MDKPSTAGPLAGRTAWARNLGASARDFLRAETGGAVVLVGAALVALVWANSPWPHSYESFWTMKLTLSLGDYVLSTDLRGLVNEGFMTLFFLVVGLEAKRELDLGELRERGRIGIPVVAAFGGMALAVALYLAINAGGVGTSGWGAAMSTDTALALGALTLVAPHGATRLRVFLLTLVVIDDLGALLVIAVVYTEQVSLAALAVALVLLVVLISLRFAGSWRA
ncbi:MAG: Na+/H+ antiporter NhaA, partial [Actinomycetota bacterium]|nr:Na+/H+ antiporter NhaA [Actinomycetota bacterium]